MKEGIGGTFMIYVFLVFLAVYITFLAVAFNYARAFRVKNKIIDDIVKFFKGAYQKQLLENVDFKTLVKDTTLVNNVRSHGERHLFTLANSRLFKQEDN